MKSKTKRRQEGNMRPELIGITAQHFSEKKQVFNFTSHLLQLLSIMTEF